MKILPYILIVYLIGFNPPDVSCQDNFKLEAAIGGAFGYVRSEYYTNSNNAYYSRSFLESGMRFQPTASPEITVYAEIYKTVGLKIAAASSKSITANKSFIQPNFALYLRDNLARDRNMMVIGITYDTQKSYDNRGADLTNITQHGRGVFLGLFGKKIKTELHYLRYNKNKSPGCYCHFKSNYPRSALYLRINYSMINLYKG